MHHIRLPAKILSKYHVMCSVSFLAAFGLLYTLSAIAMALLPERRITAIAPTPGDVDMAHIVD